MNTIISSFYRSKLDIESRDGNSITVTLYNRKASSSFFSSTYVAKDILTLVDPESINATSKLVIPDQKEVSSSSSAMAEEGHVLIDLAVERAKRAVLAQNNLVDLKSYLRARLKPNSSCGMYDNPEDRFEKLKLAKRFYTVLNNAAGDQLSTHLVELAKIYDDLPKDAHDIPTGELGKLIFNYRYQVDSNFRTTRQEPIILLAV